MSTARVAYNYYTKKQGGIITCNYTCVCLALFWTLLFLLLLKEKMQQGGIITCNYTAARIAQKYIITTGQLR